MKKYVKIFVLFLFTLYACQNEDLDDNIQIAQEVIENESELYNYLQDIVNDIPSNDELVPVNCIEFIYPIFIFTTNNENTIIGETFFSGNQEFADFLGNLSDDNNISISYPIEGTTSNGDSVSINNNEELLSSIDTCIEEEIELQIGQCEDLLNSCIWKVGYSFNDSNEYLGATFDGVGLTYFTYEDLMLSGSWNALFIGNELYVNINLIESNDISEFFNRNWLVTYIDDDTIKLNSENGNREIILNQYCEDDINNCFNLSFEMCEDISNPGFAEFILSDYDACIAEIMQLESNQSFSYYLSLQDAEMDINSIDTGNIYQNTTASNQTLFVRISYPEEPNGFKIIEISIIVVNC